MKQMITYTVDAFPDPLGRIVIRSNGGGRIYKNVSRSSLERVRRVMAGGGFVREVEVKEFEVDEFTVEVGEYD